MWLTSIKTKFIAIYLQTNKFSLFSFFLSHYISGLKQQKKKKPIEK